MIKVRKLALLPVAMLVLAACQGGSGGKTSTTASASASGGTAASYCSSASGDDLLKKICDAGVIKVSTDPNYAPQSSVKPDGTYEGFDIDMAEAIGKALGVKVQYETPKWEAITAGSWSGRWDISVGSMTITQDRTKILDFTKPYYFTPAQLASNVDSIKTIDDLAGKTVCAGASTTYVDWLQGKLNLVGAPPVVREAPAGVVVTTLPTDADCAQAWQAGRTEFQGWMSSATTVQGAIDAGIKMHKLGDPVFFEALAVALDKSGPAHAQLLQALDDIIAKMHSDGSLSAMSKKWYGGLDLTVASGS